MTSALLVVVALLVAPSVTFAGPDRDVGQERAEALTETQASWIGILWTVAKTVLGPLGPIGGGPGGGTIESTCDEGPASDPDGVICPPAGG